MTGQGAPSAFAKRAGDFRAPHAVHPIAAVQTEYSLWSATKPRSRARRREVGIGFVAFAPLGRGFLTGAIQTSADLEGRRAAHPRFQQAEFRANRDWSRRSRRSPRNGLHAGAPLAGLAAGAGRGHRAHPRDQDIHGGWMRMSVHCG